VLLLLLLSPPQAFTSTFRFCCSHCITAAYLQQGQQRTRRRHSMFARSTCGNADPRLTTHDTCTHTQTHIRTAANKPQHTHTHTHTHSPQLLHQVCPVRVLVEINAVRLALRLGTGHLCGLRNVCVLCVCVCVCAC
jgi:hypothetical protein